MFKIWGKILSTSYQERMFYDIKSLPFNFIKYKKCFFMVHVKIVCDTVITC